jgi:disulfide bond formation protein DsbB
MNIAPRWVWLAAGVLPVLAVCIALFTQHGLGMQPCPWCVLQRLIFLSISAAAWIGLALGAALPRRAMALLMSLLAAGGIAAAVWQHFVAAASASCNLTLADRVMSGSGLDNLWPEVFAPYASCAEAAATLLGVPYEFYSFTLFVLLDIAAVWLLRRPA